MKLSLIDNTISNGFKTSSQMETEITLPYPVIVTETAPPPEVAEK